MARRKEPEFTRLNLADIRTRPELFQPRDVAKGRDHDPAKVKQIIDQGWDEDVLDPIAVARDPDTPGKYVVIAGHHRYVAGRELGVDDIPAKILDGDINDPQDRRRLVTLADLSNYSISKPGLKEQVRTVSNLREQDYSDKEISDRMRLRPSQVKEIGYLGNLSEIVLGGGVNAIDYATLPDNKQFLPAVVEIGRAVEEYGLSESEAQALYTRIQRQYQDTGKVPNKNALRASLLETHRRAVERERQRAGEEAGAPGGQFGFTGEAFAESAFLGQAIDDAQAETDRQVAFSRTRRNLTACEHLAQELGVDISTVKRAAGTRLDQLTPEQEKQAREALAPETAADATAEPDEPAGPPPDMGVNLFGEMQAIPQEPDPDAEPPSVAPQMAVSGTAEKPSEKEKDIDAALRDVLKEDDAQMKAMGVGKVTERTDHLAELRQRAEATGDRPAIEAVKDIQRQDPEVLIAPEIQAARKQVEKAESASPGPAVQQTNMGDAFATEQNLVMPLGGGPGARLPLVDAGQELAKQERRELVKRGQLSLEREDRPQIAIVAISKEVKGDIGQASLFNGGVAPVKQRLRRPAKPRKKRKSPKMRSPFLYGFERRHSSARG